MENKREFFRIPIYEIPVFILSDGLKQKGKTKDLSGNGVSFYIEEQIKSKECMIWFEVQDQPFEFKGRRIREEIDEYGNYTYAFTFIETTQKEVSKLTSILLRMDAMRRRNNKK